MTNLDQRCIDPEDAESMPTVESYLAQDTRPVPAAILERKTRDLGNGTFDPKMFTSLEWQQREMDQIWKKVWRVVCREREIPNAGDYFTDDLAGQPVVVLRGEDHKIRAFYNVCQHRGNMLVEGCGNATKLACNFHGWTWDLGGKLQKVSCRWDFPEVKDDDYGLVPVQVDTWNGFVFINLDPDAGPLAEFLGEDILRHWELWPRAHYWKSHHAAKVVPWNWKLAIAQFSESYHAQWVHPQTPIYSADINSSYDQYGLHSRFHSPLGVQSPHFRGEADEQEVAEAMIGDAMAAMFGEGVEMPVPEVPDGLARPVIAEWTRQILSATGNDYSQRCDAEILDGLIYFLFPNFIIFGGVGFPMFIRVRPNGDDPDTSVFEVAFLREFPPGTEPPADTPMQFTDPETPWNDDVPGFGVIVDQDMVNARNLQRGMHSDGYRRLTLSNYQERGVRNFFQNVIDMVNS